MPRYTIIEDQPLTIDFNDLINDRAWVLNGSTATHYPCNVNTAIRAKNYAILPNIEYIVSFKIMAMSDSPLLSIGFNDVLHVFNTPQDVTVTISTTLTNQKITLWASGYVQIRSLNIQKVGEETTTDSEDTITWGEVPNRWVSFRSYRPEKGFSMFTDLFTYRDGKLYVHKDGIVRNNFYDEQFQSTAKFPVGENIVKNYHSIAIHSNIIMATTTDGITTSLGHVSDLIETDFNSREGIHYANFLRDKLDDLINGQRLKGRFLTLELTTIDGSKKLQIFKVVVKSSISTNSE